MTNDTSIINDILDSLDDLKISSVNDEAKLLETAALGIKSLEFVSIVAELANELALFYQLDERVTVPTGQVNTENFLFEISSFLSELGCPYTFLTEGNMDSRLQSQHDCLVLLLFLTSELQAAKMCFFHNPPQTKSATMSEPFQELREICLALKMAKPPDTISTENFMSGIEKKVQEAMRQCASGHLSQPVIKQQLGPVHWEKLQIINEALKKEYETRRSMLLKRLDVTILSFNWSDRAKEKVDAMASAYQTNRQSLKSKTDISLSHLLAARDDLSKISKTVSGDTRHSCAINKVKMGYVPDRGGRTDEIRAPLPEMPSWQKRTADRGGGRGGGGEQRRRGGYRGSGRGARGGSWGGGGGGDRPQSGGRRNWGRGRGGYQAGGGQFEQVFSYGGQQVSQGGFASGRHEYRS